MKLEIEEAMQSWVNKLGFKFSGEKTKQRIWTYKKMTVQCAPFFLLSRLIGGNFKTKLTVLGHLPFQH